MSQIKDDLICEIIRLSQTNLLLKKGAVPDPGGEDDSGVVEWIRNNAAPYRQHFVLKLETLSSAELGDLLKQLRGSEKNLDEILSMGSLYNERGSVKNNNITSSAVKK